MTVDLVERGQFDHAVLDLASGRVTLHDAHRHATHAMPRDLMRLSDLTVARVLLRCPDDTELPMRYPYGYDTSGQGPARPTPTRGIVRGHHHADWWGATNTLRTAGRDQDSLSLLLELHLAAAAERSPLASTWAERAAVILRRWGRRDEEHTLLQAAVALTPGPHGEIIRNRLQNVRHAL